jgi:hypothetical protein
LKTQFLEIYRLNGQIYGTPIEPSTPKRFRLEYEHCFVLPGKSASFVLVSRDHTIRRAEAIVFATALATGRYIHYHVDLSQWDTTGTIKPCPPQKPQ